MRSIFTPRYTILLLTTAIGAISVGLGIHQVGGYIFGESAYIDDVVGAIIGIALLSMIPFQIRRTYSLIKQASIDHLTGLKNRAEFVRLCTEQLRLFPESRHHLLMLDLNKFKQVNDTLGHNMGDKLLELVAKRLKETIRSNDILCRLGGDEFAIFLSDPKKENVYDLVIPKIVKAINAQTKIDDHWLYVGVSIGVATYPETGTTLTELMRCADVAMYAAKKLHRDFEVYDHNTDENTINNLTLVGEIRSAIDNGDFELYLQPKKNIQTNKITAVECLIRWNHPEKGFIGPAQFISMAESIGVIKYLTEFVIKRATESYAVLRDAGYDLNIAVNVSPDDIVDPAMMTAIIKNIVNQNMSPERFILEVTETAIMHDADAAFKVLVSLESLGIQLSIDDFGTGHSSLLYLKNFPIHEIKLDRSFIIDMLGSGESYNIIKSTIALAHQLGAITVAEGVESIEIAEMLRKLDCDEIQGYLIAKPMPLSELVNWLHTNYPVD